MSDHDTEDLSQETPGGLEALANGLDATEFYLLYGKPAAVLTPEGQRRLRGLDPVE